MQEVHRVGSSTQQDTVNKIKMTLLDQAIQPVTKGVRIVIQNLKWQSSVGLGGNIQKGLPLWQNNCLNSLAVGRKLRYTLEFCGRLNKRKQGDLMPPRQILDSIIWDGLVPFDGGKGEPGSGKQYPHVPTKLIKTSKTFVAPKLLQKV